MTTIKNKRVACGVCALSKELGYSRHHLSAVLHGRRLPGPALAHALIERGIKLPRLRRPSERWV